MQRRTAIQSLLTGISLRSSRLLAQTVTFPGKHDSTLKTLAATVLPESLGRAQTDAISLEFVRWVREYRAGAEMQTGYGATRVRYKQASPAARYLEQLETLSVGALAENSIGGRRAKIADALLSANIKDLPFSPDGGHVAADLMAFYFQSPAANDIAYDAAIGKDQCRTLKNSGSAPAKLKKGVANAAL